MRLAGDERVLTSMARHAIEFFGDLARPLLPAGKQTILIQLPSDQLTHHALGQGFFRHRYDLPILVHPTSPQTPLSPVFPGHLQRRRADGRQKRKSALFPTLPASKPPAAADLGQIQRWHFPPENWHFPPSGGKP